MSSKGLGLVTLPTNPISEERGDRPKNSVSSSSTLGFFCLLFYNAVSSQTM
jgi:hypothetical protein